MEQRKQLEQLYREMNDLLKGYAYSKLADWSRAEEAVQETFRIACGKQEILLDSENPKGWLMNTLKDGSPGEPAFCPASGVGAAGRGAAGSSAAGAAVRRSG